MQRWIFFLVSILVGIGIGLFYGWVIQPVRYTNTSLNSLGQDYKTDYVLMVAEAYSFDHDLTAATQSLDNLGDAPAHELTHLAILYAEQAGYDDRDLGLMRALQSALIPKLPTSTFTP